MRMQWHGSGYYFRSVTGPQGHSAHQPVGLKLYRKGSSTLKLLHMYDGTSITQPL